MQLSINQFSREAYQHFQDEGYCVVPGVLDQQSVTEVKAVVQELASWEAAKATGQFYDDSGKVQRVWNLINKHPVFGELIASPLIMDAMAQLFDRDTPHFTYYLSSLQANVLFPGAVRQKLHIDTPVPEPLPPWIIKANSIWLLDDFTADNGATELLPGSHKRTTKPRESDYDSSEIISVRAAAGSVLFTHGALWHRAGANQSEVWRTVLLGSFAASFAREIAAEEDQVKSLDAEVVANASPQLLEILGVDHGIKPGGDTRSPFRDH